MFSDVQLIDMTHELTPDIPTWSGSCGFKPELHLDYDAYDQGVKFRVHKLKMHAGIGTHMDAPSHCIPHGASISDIQLKDLFAPLIVIDVSSRAHADYFLSLNELITHEKQFNLKFNRALVLVYTGWSKFWNNPKKYMGMDEGGHRHFPGISKDAAVYLMDEGAVGVAIDTLSPDGSNASFPVHQAVLSQGRYLIENAANGDLLPTQGAFVCVLPINSKDVTESPVRMVGFIPRGS